MDEKLFVWQNPASMCTEYFFIPGIDYYWVLYWDLYCSPYMLMSYQLRLMSVTLICMLMILSCTILS